MNQKNCFAQKKTHEQFVSVVTDKTDYIYCQRECSTIAKIDTYHLAFIDHFFFVQIDTDFLTRKNKVELKIQAIRGGLVNLFMLILCICQFLVLSQTLFFFVPSEIKEVFCYNTLVSKTHSSFLEFEFEEISDFFCCKIRQKPRQLSHYFYFFYLQNLLCLNLFFLFQLSSRQADKVK